MKLFRYENKEKGQEMRTKYGYLSFGQREKILAEGNRLFQADLDTMSRSTLAWVHLLDFNPMLPGARKHVIQSLNGK